MVQRWLRGAVAAIDGRAAMWSNQSHSFGGTEGTGSGLLLSDTVLHFVSSWPVP